jgi:hypothetical protein
MALLLPQAQEDDLICALHGIRLAFVLRTADEGRYRLIGPCYVHWEIDWDVVEPEDGVTGLQEIVIE